MVFLLAWSGAVFTYLDLIYKKSEKTTPQVSSNNEAPSKNISGNDYQSIQKQSSIYEKKNELRERIK